MTLLRVVGIACSIVLATSTVGAAPPPEPKADYSADSTMETEGGMKMSGRVYHTPGKERMEMGGADGSVTIIRRDKKVVWQLMGNMYMELPMDQSNASDMGGFEIVEQVDVGQETVNGIKATKSKVIAVKPDGSKFGGFFWTTKEGITVKMDLLSKEGERKFRMASELTNLKIEKQDPALFEIPAGYTKNDMGALMGKGGMPNIGELMRQAEQEQDKPRPRDKRPSKSTESDDSIDVQKMLKGLFGR
jgi:hypothetical protein